MGETVVEIYINKVLDFLELAFYFILSMFIVNMFLHVTFLLSINLNVIQPIKNIAASQNAIVERDLDLIFDNFEGGLTSYSLGNDRPIEIFFSDTRMYVDNETAEDIDNYNEDPARRYGDYTSYSTIQQTQYVKAKLLVPLKIDFLGFGLFEYTRQFDINIVGLHQHDHLPGYQTLSKNSIKSDIDMELPFLEYQDTNFSYNFYLGNNENYFQANIPRRGAYYSRPTGNTLGQVEDEIEEESPESNNEIYGEQ